jgi:hypothetical protein
MSYLWNGMEGGVMNPLNTATLPACQRLAAAGIVLETDHYWYKDYDGTWKLSNDLDEFVRDRDYVSAPSPAEVWRELPKQENSVRFGAYLEVSKTIDFAGNEVTYAGYLRDGIASADYTSANLTDALIDLLIWVRG